MRCYTCETGEDIPKQDDLPIEEIEKDMNEIRSPQYMDEFSEWLKTRPLKVREMARNFPPFQLYEVNKGAPYRFTCEGSIVSSYSFIETKSGRVEIRFKVLRSPKGYAGVVAEIDPQYVTPITLDDLKKKVASL